MRRALRAVRRAVRREAQGASAPSAVILLYHRIGEGGADPWALSVTPKRLSEHLERLRRVFQVVPLRLLPRALRQRPRRVQVALTFDDGYLGTLTVAKPLLEEAGLPATAFVTSGGRGEAREFWWDALARILLDTPDLPQTLVLESGGRPRQWTLTAAPGERPMPPAAAAWRAWDPPPGPREAAYRDLYALCLQLPDREQRRLLEALHAWSGVDPAPRSSHRILGAASIAELAGDLVEIGAHTVTHPVLATLPGPAQSAEIVGSRQDLERVTGRRVTSFAYPYGRPEHFTPETTALVRRAGFERACVNWPGRVTPGTDPFLWPRLHVQDWPAEALQAHLLNGAVEEIQRKPE